MPEEYGGAGGRFAHETVINRAIAHAGLDCARRAAALRHRRALHPQLRHRGAEEEWLPKLATGELIGAIAMSEPGTGSDLQGVRTTAKKSGNGYVLNGSKTFITNGQHANLIIVVAKTDPAAGAKGTSLMVVETDDAQGFRRGRKLNKLGLDWADTSELFFEDVKLPAEGLLGPEEGQGFVQLMNELPQERLIVCTAAIGMIERALRLTIDYVKERKAFGKAIIDFQNTQFELAECKSEATIGRVFHDHCVERHIRARARYRHGLDGEILADRPAEQDRRPLPAIVRRLWLYGRVSDLAHVSRRARAAHLRRHQRDHEAADREEFVTPVMAGSRASATRRARVLDARARHRRDRRQDNDRCIRLRRRPHPARQGQGRRLAA